MSDREGCEWDCGTAAVTQAAGGRGGEGHSVCGAVEVGRGAATVVMRVGRTAGAAQLQQRRTVSGRTRQTLNALLWFWRKSCETISPTKHSCQAHPFLPLIDLFSTPLHTRSSPSHCCSVLALSESCSRLAKRSGPSPHLPRPPPARSSWTAPASRTQAARPRNRCGERRLGRCAARRTRRAQPEV